MQLSLTHNGKTYTNFEAGDLLAAGVPDEVIAAAVTEEAVAFATTQIDTACDGLFTQSASRAQRYSQKYEEALAYREADYPGTVADGDYPFLVAEAAARSLTKRQQADLVIETAERFRAIGAIAEAARASLPDRINAMAGPAAKFAEARQAVLDFQQALQAQQTEEA